MGVSDCVKIQKGVTNRKRLRNTASEAQPSTESSLCKVAPESHQLPTLVLVMQQLSEVL